MLMRKLKIHGWEYSSQFMPSVLKLPTLKRAIFLYIYLLYKYYCCNKKQVIFAMLLTSEAWSPGEENRDFRMYV